ncbi:MAG: hypothetical protein JXR91_14470 [Deltaproteobacteria bacterium]|nr:hypothetical protein [Deltaproteobacteria bacterium]
MIMKPQKILNLTIALALMTVANIALAQSPEVQIMQLNKQAMDDYGNLDIEASQASLKQAEELCLANSLTGSPLARTYINMGMVQYGGLGDNASAMESFKKALCYDSTVMLDPLNSTPDMEILYTGAKNQVQASGCAGIVQTQAPVGPTVAPGPVTPAPATVVNNDVLRHTPVTQQKRLMPIPVYIQTNPSKDVSSVILYYRTVGERIFQQLQMKNNQQAWFAIIDCDVLTTFDPTGLDYYVAVLDSQNQILATAGSEAQPFQISIVDVVTSPPPAVPGEEAPAACQAECPPWNPNCNEANCAKYADICSDSEPCCSGLACVDGVCEEGAGGGGDDESISSGGSGKSINSHVRIFLNAGTGAGLIGSGDYSKDDFSNKLDNQDINVPVSIALNKLHLRLGALFQLPIDKLEIGFNVRGDLPLSPDYSPIAISAIANIAYRIAGENAEKGFQAYAVAGLGWMNIMHRVKFPDCYTANVEETGCASANWATNDSVDKNGFIKSGFLGVELGLDMNYFFVKNFGLNFGAIIDVVFPTFAANLDIQAGIALRF